MTAALIERTLAEIIQPTVAAMRRRGTPFRGVLYAGLMLTAEGPKLIEYNVRFGDPETQALLLRLDSDLLELLAATAEGRLAGVTPRWSDDAALTVVMAARGYPGVYTKGDAIRGIDRANALPGVKVFHAGTALSGGTLVAAGGRVLNVTARGASIAERGSGLTPGSRRSTGRAGFAGAISGGGRWRRGLPPPEIALRFRPPLKGRLRRFPHPFESARISPMPIRRLSEDMVNRHRRRRGGESGRRAW